MFIIAYYGCEPQEKLENVLLKELQKCWDLALERVHEPCVNAIGVHG